MKGEDIYEKEDEQNDGMRVCSDRSAFRLRRESAPFGQF